MPGSFSGDQRIVVVVTARVEKGVLAVQTESPQAREELQQADGLRRLEVAELEIFDITREFAECGGCVREVGAARLIHAELVEERGTGKGRLAETELPQSRRGRAWRWRPRERSCSIAAAPTKPRTTSSWMWEEWRGESEYLKTPSVTRRASTVCNAPGELCPFPWSLRVAYAKQMDRSQSTELAIEQVQRVQTPPTPVSAGDFPAPRPLPKVPVLLPCQLDDVRLGLRREIEESEASERSGRRHVVDGRSWGERRHGGREDVVH